MERDPGVPRHHRRGHAEENPQASTAGDPTEGRDGAVGVLTRSITHGLPQERRGHWEMQFWVKIDMNLLVWMVLLREEKRRFDLVI